jgi:hypothetical protein
MSETWDESHFEQMSFHDVNVHGLSIRQGDELGGQLALDLDYILEWLTDDEAVVEPRRANRDGRLTARAATAAGRNRQARPPRDRAEAPRIRLTVRALEHDPKIRERAQVVGQAHAGPEAGEHQRDRVRDGDGDREPLPCRATEPDSGRGRRTPLEHRADE